jgi:Rieske Fe-S protein
MTAEPQVKQRRSALKVVSGVILGMVGLVLFVPSLVFLSDPLKRRQRRTESGDGPRDDEAAGTRALLCRLDEVPDLDAGAAPLRAQVVATGLRDAWNRLETSKLGSVFLGKSRGRLTCLSATCPHAGCGIDFDEKRQEFVCPCHNSAFALDGSRKAGPSPRDMDSLDVAVEGDTVYCRFQRFRLAVGRKVEV